MGWGTCSTVERLHSKGSSHEDFWVDAAKLGTAAEIALIGMVGECKPDPLNLKSGCNLSLRLMESSGSR